MPIKGDASPLDLAIELAARHHAGQKDKAGRPYILHPMRVMTRVETELEMMAAALHDTLEDTDCTEHDLRGAGIPEEVIAAVVALTHDKKKESTAAYLKRVAANPIAKRVKLADVEDNLNVRRLSRVGEKDRARLDKYLHTWHFLTEGTAMPAEHDRVESSDI